MEWWPGLRKEKDGHPAPSPGARTSGVELKLRAIPSLRENHRWACNVRSGFILKESQAAPKKLMLKTNIKTSRRVLPEILPKVVLDSFPPTANAVTPTNGVTDTKNAIFQR